MGGEREPQCRAEKEFGLSVGIWRSNGAKRLKFKQGLGWVSGLEFSSDRQCLKLWLGRGGVTGWGWVQELLGVECSRTKSGSRHAVGGLVWSELQI